MPQVISPARRFQKTKIQLPTLNPNRAVRFKSVARPYLVRCKSVCRQFRVRFSSAWCPSEVRWLGTVILL